MQYTVAFFAVQGEELNGRMREEPAEVLSQVRDFLEDACEEPEDVPLIMAAAEALCRGDVPADASQEYFDAFFAIVSVLAESLEISGFEFNNSPYLHDVGIWPWTQQVVPPFPAPKSDEELMPKIGYLPAGFILSTVPPGLGQLPPCRQGGDRARMEFGEVAESIADDGLDLIAYHSVW